MDSRTPEFDIELLEARLELGFIGGIFRRIRDWFIRRLPYIPPIRLPRRWPIPLPFPVVIIN